MAPIRQIPLILGSGCTISARRLIVGARLTAADQGRIRLVAACDIGCGIAIELLGPQTIRTMLGILLALRCRSRRGEEEQAGEGKSHVPRATAGRLAAF